MSNQISAQILENMDGPRQNFKEILIEVQKSKKPIKTYPYIATEYLGVSRRVISRDPNPIGTGLQTWFFIFVHLLATLIVGLYGISKSNDKRSARNKLLAGIISIIVIITIYLCISGIIDNWLWSLRKDVIQ